MSYNVLGTWNWRVAAHDQENWQTVKGGLDSKMACCAIERKKEEKN